MVVSLWRRRNRRRAAVSVESLRRGAWSIFRYRRLMRALRLAVWKRIAGDLKPRHLDKIATRTIDLEQLPDAFGAYIDNSVTGRTVVLSACLVLAAGVLARASKSELVPLRTPLSGSSSNWQSA